MIRQRLARTIARMPIVGPRYLRALVRALERTPRAKLTPELRQAQAMLSRLPPEQQVELLRKSLRGELPEPEQLGRSARRAAARQSRRGR